ncbi:M1 family metallopeptidase [Pedobacter arcticus]|uniref:M1 family metallopeptidase n=1 Tax=Pedobacter arcticus TaxID=752140 RepID=UPI0013760EAD|nr:M1 family metallopeptidase [Pedobacter arcticus]
MLVTILLFATAFTQAQQQNPDSVQTALSIYRATPEKINDLVNTKLDVKFDYKKAYLLGKAWITLKPHFYPTDSLNLDAKGMEIKNVSIVNGNISSPLKYKYDGLELKIDLGKTYKSSENYTVYIAYTAKPNEFKVKGSAAITDAKGLYFINPDSSVKGKPVQIWTQGETEGSSVWFPTIDKTNQKTTQEISMTVLDKYVTLSNGALVAQKKNADGTRTDTWKMDQPHAPYLFMMAVGDFKVYHDKYKNIPVDYYLEPAYAPYAKDIFGKTPAMMDFFAKKLGVEYPWNKYAQIVVRDYVSGAMENTTATLHGAYVQQTKRELLDGSNGEETIAHELFHQWFGDYVTAESWSNLSVNESFADFSETLWAEHSKSQDAGDAHNYESMQAYLLSPEAKNKHLVRFHYVDKEDMFDVVTYQKGGRILNMLRNYLGEEAFFKGLNLYLKTNALGNGEAHQLRLALEQVSGRDLNWFFNQWYFGSGHPELNISYKWDAVTKTQTVYLAQTQKENVFTLPMKIDVYEGGKKVRHNYWMTTRTDSISFKLNSKPNLVNVDADKILLVAKKDEKSLEEFAFQYKNAPLYVDRLEAIAAATERINEKTAQEVLVAALNDPYFGLRTEAINNLKLQNEEIKKAVLSKIVAMASTDNSTLVRAAAIESLANLQDKIYKPLFIESLKNPSYAVEAAALNAVAAIDISQAKVLANGLQKDSKGPLVASIVNIYGVEGGDAEFPYVYNSFMEAGTQSQFDMIPGLASILMNVKNITNLQQGLDELQIMSEKFSKYGIHKYVNVMLNNILMAKKDDRDKAPLADKAGFEAQIAAVQKAITELEKL